MAILVDDAEPLSFTVKIRPGTEVIDGKVTTFDPDDTSTTTKDILIFWLFYKR